MAEDITFVHFRYGTYAEINNSANNKTLNPHAVYIATDKQLMYAKGAWIGVTSVTSEVNQDTGEITLKFNYDSEGQPAGNPITCSIKGAGMTTEQKAQLETAYNFAINIGGTSADDVINKWQEVVDFLAGIEGGTLEGIVATKADKNTTITAGDGLTGGGDLSENRTINVVSADDGITVNSDNIQLNTVDNLTTSSKTKPLSANQGKVLDGKVKSITDLVNDMFEKVTDNGKTYIKTKYGFASDKFVSAGGTDDTESGGGGGANLTQMWESLQDNNDTFKDRLINVAHIPTLTTGKISDFVSATQAIADTAVANKADKATTLEGYGITDAFTWKRVITSTTTDDKALWGKIGIQTYGEVLPDGLTGQYNYGVLASFNNNTGTGPQFQLYASDSRTVLPYNRHIAWRSGLGENKGSWRKLANIDTENTFTESQTFQKQIKSTIATGTAPFSVASTTLVANLNAEMLENLRKDGFQQAVYTYFPLSQSADIANTTTLANIIANNKTGDKDNYKFYDTKFFSSASSTSSRAQIAYGYAYDNIHFRRYYNGAWTAWKTIAFTDQFDNYLPLTGGTLTGALTVNAPINNTGALKLLGASEVGSTGMAVHTGAKALGLHANALGANSYAGVKTSDGTGNVELFGYKSLPVEVDGNTVYGFELVAGETKTFTFSGAEYSITNPHSTQLASVFLIPIDSTFAASVSHPLNYCSVIEPTGLSRGRNPFIIKIQSISDNVVALCIYNTITEVTTNDFSGEYTIYAFKTTTSSNYQGDYAFAGNYNSLAVGKYSVSLGYQSLAAGSRSIAMGNYATATNKRAVAIGNYSIALGEDSFALGSNSVAKHNNSRALGYFTTTGRNYQTVIGLYNEIDTDSLFVIGAGSTGTSRKNVFTVSSSGKIYMGDQLRIGVGGKNEVYLQSDVGDQLYVHTSAGVPFLIQGGFVRRGSSAPKTTLGTDQYKWFNVFTEALKIADANLTYDTGTLTIDKALTVASTLTAPQGVFSNYIKIGNATISWNPKGYLVIDEGLASHKFISAGGVVTGDAGGGGGGLSLTDMWASLNGNIDAYGKSKIHIDHIPLDAILSHDDYENDVADRINTFNYSNSSSFTSAVKALIVADNIPTLEMSKIEGLEDTLTDIGTVVQSNYETLNTLITNNHNDHEARIKALEQALTWQTV